MIREIGVRKLSFQTVYFFLLLLRARLAVSPYSYQVLASLT